MKIILWLILGAAAGAGGTYWYCQSISCKPAAIPEDKGLREIYITNKPPKIAHELSVNYRKANSLCDCKLHPNFFEMNAYAAREIAVAVAEIEAKLTTEGLAVPKFFRFVWGDSIGKTTAGMDTAITKLMAVGLKDDLTEYGNYIYAIDGNLPCPKLCDINKSEIVMGNPADPTQNCCK